MQADKIPDEIESEARGIAEELLGTIWRQRDVTIIASALMARDTAAREECATIASDFAHENFDAYRPEAHQLAESIAATIEATIGGRDEQR